MAGSGFVDPVTRSLMAARAGDDAAAATFVRATQAEVWRFVAALVGRDAADDLTQDTYLRAFRALADFAVRSTARTWLLGIARRACADHIRSLTRLRRRDDRLATQPQAMYVPDQAGFDQGGYETWAARSAAVERGSGEQLVSAAQGLLARLFGK